MNAFTAPLAAAKISLVRFYWNLLPIFNWVICLFVTEFKNSLCILDASLFLSFCLSPVRYTSSWPVSCLSFSEQYPFVGQNFIILVTFNLSLFFCLLWTMLSVSYSRNLCLTLHKKNRKFWITRRSRNKERRQMANWVKIFEFIRESANLSSR